MGGFPTFPVSVGGKAAVVAPVTLSSAFRLALRRPGAGVDLAVSGPGSGDLFSALAEASKRGAPLVVFPEACRTNGEGVVDFAPGLFESLSELKEPPRVHIIAFQWTRARAFNPQAPLRDMLGLAGMFKSVCQVRYVEAGLLTPLPIKTAKPKPGSRCRTIGDWSAFAQEVMAASVNKPALKGLDASDAYEFAAFYSCDDKVKAGEMAAKRSFRR